MEDKYRELELSASGAPILYSTGSLETVSRLNTDLGKGTCKIDKFN